MKTPRTEKALAVIKYHFPDASDWIDDRALWLEFSDITKCMSGGNADAKSTRLIAAATAWRRAKAETIQLSTTDNNDRRLGVKVF